MGDVVKFDIQDFSETPFWYSRPIKEIILAFKINFYEVDLNNIFIISSKKRKLVFMDVVVPKAKDDNPNEVDYIHTLGIFSIYDRRLEDYTEEEIRKGIDPTGLKKFMLSELLFRARKSGFIRIKDIPFKYLVDIRNILTDQRIKDIKDTNAYTNFLDKEFTQIIVSMVNNGYLKAFEMDKNVSAEENMTRYSLYKTNIIDVFVDLFSAYNDLFTNMFQTLNTFDVNCIPELQTRYSIDDEKRAEIEKFIEESIKNFKK